MTKQKSAVINEIAKKIKRTKGRVVDRFHSALNKANHEHLAKLIVQELKESNLEHVAPWNVVKVRRLNSIFICVGLLTKSC